VVARGGTAVLVVALLLGGMRPAISQVPAGPTLTATGEGCVQGPVRACATYRETLTVSVEPPPPGGIALDLTGDGNPDLTLGGGACDAAGAATRCARGPADGGCVGPVSPRGGCRARRPGGCATATADGGALRAEVGTDCLRGAGRVALAVPGGGQLVVVREPPRRAAHRVAGADRYATAVAISRRAFPGTADEVWLAPGEGAPAGPAPPGPVLLVPACGPLPDVVRAELARLAPARVSPLGPVCDALLAEARRG